MKSPMNGVKYRGMLCRIQLVKSIKVIECRIDLWIPSRLPDRQFEFLGISFEDDNSIAVQRKVGIGCTLREQTVPPATFAHAIPFSRVRGIFL